ncbi:M20/M25/M40 family metallo-hydrolase [Ruficoccus amylovorans]|uniref:M20/M25/M40 family metallo-hydrolase n=1 Tax=Ruficoccus amylovorans TaxID=1804625 RepID=A0A842HKN9_9BACT|nr:M20/M25/M40 family metallo-hydrolase [Ruficoccus amylovorans]MBC2595711.1 M20/M25/M40 family metallo-hydrolase [Ruficoccus amylovorans]
MSDKIPSITELLSTLVSCPSVNPGERLHWESPYGEARLAQVLQDLLRPWADSIEIDEVVPGRPNLRALFRGRADGPKRALEAHLDTVDIDGMSIEPFEPELKAGRLYGRGSADTKGPMTAMLLALIRAKAKGIKLNGDWTFIATCDEELGARGARFLIEQGFCCDGIIVAEPTELELIDAHKGVERYRVEITGKAAHSAYPELGLNAISALADFIGRLEAMSFPSTSRPDDDTLGPITMSVGVISGGDQVNRVPQTAHAEIDFRIPPGAPETAIGELLAQAAHSTRQSRPGIEIRWEQTQHYPALHPQPDSAFSETLWQLAKEHLNARKFSRVRYATNAGFYSAAGIPSIVFGPGSISEAHTAAESIEIDAIEQAASFLEKLITVPAH